MSVVGIPSTTLPNSHTGHCLSSADAKTMRELDASVDIIRNYIPTDPYILTVPSTDPYQHRSRQDAEAWRRGTFFDSDEEEEVQYSTFLYREQGESLFVCRSTVDIDRDRREKERKLVGFRSGANTPSGSTGPKKKISLSAYKSKHAQAAGSKKSEKDGSPSSKVLPVHKETQVCNGSPALAQNATQAGRKRFHMPIIAVPCQYFANNHIRSFDASRSQHDLHNENDHAEKKNSPTKKSRHSHELRQQDTQVQNGKWESHKLPRRLSPEYSLKEQGLPPLLSPENLPNRHGLPHQLSPTLPPSVESEIQKTKDFAQTPDLAFVTSHQSCGGKRLPLANEQKGVGVGKMADVNVINNSTSSKTLPNALSKGETKQKNNTHPNHLEVQAVSKVVKFRFSKKYKKEFERLIKLPKKGLSASHEDKDRKEHKEGPEASSKTSCVADEPKVNGEKSTAYSNDSKSPGKRKRDVQEPDLGVQTPKRQKAPNSAKLSPHPHTPAHPYRSSPTLPPNSAAIKNRHLTPSKAAARVPLTRTVSGDSLGATPIGSGSTPTVNRNMPPTSNALSDEWLRIGRDMNELARDLKRAAQDLLKHEDLASYKQGVLMTMEALL